MKLEIQFILSDSYCRQTPPLPKIKQNVDKAIYAEVSELAWPCEFVK